MFTVCVNDHVCAQNTLICHFGNVSLFINLKEHLFPFSAMKTETTTEIPNYHQGGK